MFVGETGVGRVLQRTCEAMKQAGIDDPSDIAKVRALGVGLTYADLLQRVGGGRRAGRFAALSEVVTDPAAYTRPATCDWATGAVMLVTRRCLDTVGAWDESFFLYSEETDFALRAGDAGLRVRLAPAAEAVHVGGEAHTSPRLWALLTANRVRLFTRRAGTVRGAAFWSAVLAGEALRAARGGRSAGPHRAALNLLLGQRRNILGGRCVDFSP